MRRYPEMKTKMIQEGLQRLAMALVLLILLGSFSNASGQKLGVGLQAGFNGAPGGIQVQQYFSESQTIVYTLGHTDFFGGEHTAGFFQRCG
jgi:hypothetical protein